MFLSLLRAKSSVIVESGPIFLSTLEWEISLSCQREIFSREKAYSIVQKNAQNSHKKNISFHQSLMNDSLINKKISNKDLKKMFDLNYHTKKINMIFNRVFK